MVENLRLEPSGPTPTLLRALRNAKKCQGVVGRTVVARGWNRTPAEDRGSGREPSPRRDEEPIKMKLRPEVYRPGRLGPAPCWARPAPRSAAEYANVVSATPVTGSFPVPRQQCVDGQRVVPAQPSGGGALVGAIIGGVVGNQFGHGVGRAAATGHRRGRRLGASATTPRSTNNPGQVVPVRDCRTVSSYESRVVGYDVVYEYHGQRYTTRTAERPGPAPGDRRAAGGRRRPTTTARRAAAIGPCPRRVARCRPPTASRRTSRRRPADYPAPPAAYYSPAPAPPVRPRAGVLPGPGLLLRPALLRRRRW